MATASEKTMRVDGLRDLHRAFAAADKTLNSELRSSLRGVAEPVRRGAEQLSLRQIRNIGPRWSRMRVGVTQTSVYVAPVERGRKSATRRPNLADLLMDRAMQPALDANQEDVVVRFEEMLDTVGKVWEHV